MTIINPRAALTRQPRALLMVGDVPVPFEEIVLTHSGTYEAGTLHAVILSPPGVDIGQWQWWLGQSVILLDVYAGEPANPQQFGAADLTHLATIRVDELQFDPVNRSITLTGRDLTALLIDIQTSGQFQNQTASDVATLFAKQAGLQAQIQPTTTRIGSYYAHDHVHLQREQSQWALLTYLARMAGVQCFVLGRTLYFGQFRPQGTADRYLIEYSSPDAARGFATANAMSLRFTHDLTLARDVIVTVRSYDKKHPRGFSVVAKTTGAAALAAQHLTPITSGTVASPQNYAYTFPGLSVQAAQAKALALAQEIALHEYRMEAELPGDDVLYPWVQIEVVGTGTVFDQIYYPDTVTRTIRADAFSMTVSAKNHPTETEVQLQ